MATGLALVRVLGSSRWEAGSSLEDTTLFREVTGLACKGNRITVAFGIGSLLDYFFVKTLEFEYLADRSIW